MCLYVRESFVKNPIHGVECFKELICIRGDWKTPYQGRSVEEGTGWFMPEYLDDRTEEFYPGDPVNAGYLHAYTSTQGYYRAHYRLPLAPVDRGRYMFAAIALDVFATNSIDEELICNALYIPAFDKTGKHKNAILDLGTSKYHKLGVI